jgi:agmatine deiminase
MITDAESDFLFLSDKLKARAGFYHELTTTLNANNIAFACLPQTKDIWAVDYMPVQVHRETFVQFRYDPDYLRGKKWISTKTNPQKVTNCLGINTIQSRIVLDGGNLIKGKGWVILTNKIFDENPSTDRLVLLNELEKLFEVKPIIIPREPYDFTGHADGIVRYYDEGTVLINRYRKDKNDAFQKKLSQILKAENLNAIEVPYWPYDNTSYSSAKGIYINYLHMKDFVLVPVFGIPEDGPALLMFEQLFPNSAIQTIDSNEVAVDGGVLNCITWNVKA